MRLIITFLTFITISLNGFSQDRAPSLYLNYQGNFQGDILINTVRVQSPSSIVSNIIEGIYLLNIATDTEVNKVKVVIKR